MTFTASSGITHIFLPRYDVLREHYIGGVWNRVPADLIRDRPHPRVNSIAWNLWHLARVEDAGVNLMVTERGQVMDEGTWRAQMNVPLRHQGTGMTLPEVDDLSARIDLDALRAYGEAVEARTRDVVAALTDDILSEPVPVERLRKAILEKGLAHSDPQGLLVNYSGWTHAKCLTHFALTHSYQHVGEMDVITSLHGIVF